MAGFVQLKFSAASVTFRAEAVFSFAKVKKKLGDRVFQRLFVVTPPSFMSRRQHEWKSKACGLAVGLGWP